MSGYTSDRHGRLIDPVTGSIIGVIDSNGNEQYTAASVGTIAQMLASSPSTGAMFRTTDTFQVNGSTNPIGNEWIYDGTQWRPRGFQRICVHSTVVTGALQTAEQVLKTITLPIGVLHLQRWRVDFLFGKNGATDVANLCSVRMGTAGTTADAQLSASSSTMLASGKRSMGISLNFESVSATSVQKRGTSGTLDNGSFSVQSGNNAPQAATTVASLLTNAIKLSVTGGMATAASDSPMCGEVYITLEP